jgi:hypothetical protein
VKRTRLGMLGFLGVVAIVTALAIPAPAGATTGPTVSATVNITTDQFANNEESLGMSPNGQLLAGAWNDWEYNDGCGFSYSTDGGGTWAPETFVPGLTLFTNDPDVPGTGRFAIAGDPAVAYNPASGVFDVMCQAFGHKGNQAQLLLTTFDPAQADPNADVNDSYGTDAWTTPASVAIATTNGAQKGSNGHFPDHESITVDTGTGAGHHYGRVFVTWASFSGAGRSAIRVSYSDDDGASWTGPIQLSANNDQFNQDARAAVGPDGTVYVSWANSPNEKSLRHNRVMIVKSADGGATWTRNVAAASIVSPIPGTLPGSTYRIFEDAWSAVDQVRGTVQVAFTDRTGPSGASNVYVTHNLVAGDLSAWSAPVAVRPSAGQQFFPWISAAPNGRVDVVFYDRTCDLPANVKDCVTLGSSTNGGASWSRTALTTTGFDGDRFFACLAFVDPVDCGRTFLGDYIAVASNNSTAQVLYTGNGAHAMDVFSVHADF